VVGGRGEEAEETILSVQITARVVALDADAVHRHGAMDARAAVRLGDDEEVFLARVLTELARQRLAAPLGGFRANGAQDAEAARWHRAGRARPDRAGGECCARGDSAPR